MYTVKKCTYPLSDGSTRQGYIIDSTSAHLSDLMWINSYLHKLANKSAKTAYQYAHRLCKFLSFLELIGKTYWECTDTDIVRYMRSLQYDTSTKVISITEQVRSPEALGSYYYPVRGLFIYLYQCKQPLKVEIELVQKYNRDRYLQGIAPALTKPDLVLDQAYEHGAKRREYIRWYTEEQKLTLLCGFRSLRDKTIISLGLDGFRIDEILSARMRDYDQARGILTPYRSKRKADGSEMRSAPLSDRSVHLLEDYLINERGLVEATLEDNGKMMPDEIFVVLRHGESYGQPLKYNNFWQILKSAARRMGFDPSMVRTHSGRSTRANEVFTDMAKHPGKWTEQDILDLFGWASFKSAKPYINKNDPDRTIAIAKKLEETDKERRERSRNKNENNK